VNAWKVILATLVIFIAGVITGGLLVRNAMRVEQLVSSDISSKQQPRPSRPTNGPGNGQIVANNPWAFRNRELLRRMDRELELTPAQHQDVEKIMTTSEEQTKSLWKPIAPLMNKEMQLVRAEIRNVLTPEQQRIFDGFNKGRPLQRRPTTNSNGADSMFNAMPAPADTTTNAPAK
jgi:hypothetical protein